MAAMTASQTPESQAGDSAGRVIERGGIAYWLSGALALAATGSSLATFLIAGVLRGIAVMNGSARGTSLVVLLIGVPLLAGSMLAASRGSARAVLAWLGAAAFLLYNSLMFVFATPVTGWSCCIWRCSRCRPGPLPRCCGRPMSGHWPAASHRVCPCGESPPTYRSSSR